MCVKTLSTFARISASCVNPLLAEVEYLQLKKEKDLQKKGIKFISLFVMCRPGQAGQG
jgi:hypothetical protein